MEKLTQRKIQALQTKTKIFTCAVNLFAEDTYEKITIQDICKAADVSVGAFYHHFSSKADILDVGYHLFDEQIRSEQEELAAMDSIEAIRVLIIKSIHAMNGLGMKGTLQYFKNQLTNGERYILNQERYFYKILHQNVENAIASGILAGEANLITDELLSMSRGMIYDWCLHEGTYSLEERVLKLTDMILNYYRKY